MCGTNQNEACGWPQGTVRGIISYTSITLTIAVAAVITIFFAWNNQYGWAMSSLGIMCTIIGSMVGFYFGTKVSENATRLVNEAHNNLLQNTITNHERTLMLIRTMHNNPGLHVDEENMV